MPKKIFIYDNGVQHVVMLKKLSQVSRAQIVLLLNDIEKITTKLYKTTQPNMFKKIQANIRKEFLYKKINKIVLAEI